MENPLGCVERLAELIGSVQRVTEEYDWPAVEGSLGGLSLPRDYKAFVETFPPHWIRERIRVTRPGDVDHPKTDYLGFYAQHLEELRHKGCPYPVFPEPAGVLPWGRGANRELYFWRTDGDDPDAWTVVWCDADGQEWRTFPGTMCEFLSAVVTGEVEVPAPPPEVPALRPARWGEKMPENEFEELARVLGTAYPRPAKPDWAAFEDEVGLVFPADYREFIDRYGVGVFCDIRIAGPDPCPEFDLRFLLRQQIEQAQSSPRARLAFGNANRAIFAWGETLGGWLCGWGATGPDSATWGTVTVTPTFVPAFTDELSFSTFLLHYSGHRDQLNVFFAREPWPGGPTFQPHGHE